MTTEQMMAALFSVADCHSAQKAGASACLWFLGERSVAQQWLLDQHWRFEALIRAQACDCVVRFHGMSADPMRPTNGWVSPFACGMCIPRSGALPR